MTVYHKPSGFTKFLNGIFGALFARGIGPKNSYLIEVPGRKTGQIRSVPVNIVEFDGQRYLVAPRGETEWVRNARAAGGKANLRRGKAEQVQLEEVPTAERAPIIQKYLGENAMATKASFGIEPGAPISEFERIAPIHPVFRISPRS
jgi:deazaflavin-dependent oxidoreductase (nitroreductase family)